MIARAAGADNGLDAVDSLLHAELTRQDELERCKHEEPNGEPAGRARDQAQGGP